jgi:hypothetical protein
MFCWARGGCLFGSCYYFLASRRACATFLLLELVGFRVFLLGLRSFCGRGSDKGKSGFADLARLIFFCFCGACFCGLWSPAGLLQFAFRPKTNPFRVASALGFVVVGAQTAQAPPYSGSRV